MSLECRTVARLLPWTIAAAYGVYVKYTLLNTIGFARVEHLLDLPNSLSLLQRVSLFREDLAIMGYGMPLLLWFVSRRWHSVLAFGLILAVTLLSLLTMYVQYYCFLMTGSFQSLDMLMEGLSFGMTEPTVMYQYLRHGVPKLGILTGSLALATAVAVWLTRRDCTICVHRFPLVALFTIVLAGVWWPWLPTTPEHRGFLPAALRGLISENDPPGAFAGLPQAELKREFMRRVGFPESSEQPEYWAAATGYDVVLFVMETVPSVCLDLQGDLSDLPHLAALRSSAWIAEQHLTTFPNSSYAIFSLLSSMYPTSRNILSAQGARELGLMSVARRHGYRTACYLPARLPLRDVDMYRYLGAEHIVIGARPEKQLDALQERRWRDEDILARALADIRKWVSAEEHYIICLQPQIGHAPWPDLQGELELPDPATELYQRGRRIVALQDRWIGEIRRVLSSLGRDQRTLLVVTADHGIRTRLEDPGMRGGLVNDISYRLPLLLHVPGVLEEPVSIPYVTSHIDLAPSILALLGFTRAEDYEQGAPLWEPAIAHRRTYLFGREFLGYDGYHERGIFHQWRASDETAHVSRSLDPSDARVLTKGSREWESVKRECQTIRALQSQWARNVIAGGREQSTSRGQK